MRQFSAGRRRALRLPGTRSIVHTLILIATLAWTAPCVARAQTVGAPPAARASVLLTPGRNATVSLLTMGNGDLIWELFGHTAIMIRDNTSGRDTVLNWGVFDASKPHFILHFLQGLNLYQMGGETLSQLLYEYRYFNRSVTSQELDLTAPQRDSLLQLIRVNAEPQHLEYRYDYFRDNCSTRPRDLLDRVLGGQMSAKAGALTGTTYRSQAMRLMQGDRPLVVGVDIGLGEPSDEELTTWKAMFLPRVLHDFVGTLQVRDSAGTMHPLVRREQVLFRGTRGPEPGAPPKLAGGLLAIGVLAAGLMLWLAARAARSRGARTALTIMMSAWCIIAGLLGTVLALLWGVTDHVFAHDNENLLLFNPLWLVLGVLIAVHLTTGRARRTTGYLAAALAGLCVLALVAHAAMVSRQSNFPIIFLALPVALAIAWLSWPSTNEGESRVRKV
jgi:hypothetical protein